MTKILVLFRMKSQWTDFCLQELKSLLWQNDQDIEQCFQKQFQKEHYQIRNNDFIDFPFVIIEIQDLNILDNMIQRSVTINKFIKLLSDGKNYEELLHNVNQEELIPYTDEKSTISFKIDAVFKNLNKEEQMQILDKFECLQIKGKFDLKNPQIQFWVVEQYIRLPQDNRELKQIFFGVEMARQFKSKITFNHKYELPNRIYLGPTSTDNDLAFIMINQAQVQAYDMVLDPFVGSGSILIAASHHNALCFGGDIDSRILHGKGVGRANKQSDKFNKPNFQDLNIFSNFKQYDLLLPEIYRADMMHSKFSECLKFDAIVCDPPYGIRAGSRITGSNYDELNQKLVQENPNQFAPTVNILFEELVNELFQLANQCLKQNGRLVFLYPINKELNKIDKKLIEFIDRNPNYRLIDYSETSLDSQKSRLLLTFKKLK